MGNFDGNTAVENGRASSRDLLGRNLFFSSGSRVEDHFSKQLKSSMEQLTSSTLSSPFYKVRGQVIAIPTSHCSKISDVVDLRVERPECGPDRREKYQKTTSLFSNKTSPSSSCSSDTEESATKLKFGIESLLGPETSEAKPSKSGKELFKSNGSKRKLSGQSYSSKFESDQDYKFSDSGKLNAHAEKYQKLFLTSQTSNDSVEYSRCSSKLDQFKRHNADHRVHPYAKSLFERSQSDPARSPSSNSPYARFRRKSDSPDHPHSKPCSPVEVPSSLTFPRNTVCHQISRPNSGHDPSTSRQTSNDVTFYPTESHQKNNPHYSDSDEVFKDESERDPSAAVLAQIMKQRNMILEKSYPIPNSPEILSNMNKQKYNQLGYFSSLNQALAGIPPTSPPGFNFQGFSGMPGSCHPLFSSSLNPYVYNPSAAAAYAIMRSLKTVPSMSMMTTSPHLMGASSKGHFTFSGTNADFQQGENKKGGPNKRRKWTRAVFSVLQRRALEDSFKGQKYVAKPERRFLAERLGLTDAQVKIWFQNRRMKWRQEQKSKHGTSASDLAPTSGEESYHQAQDQACST